MLNKFYLFYKDVVSITLFATAIGTPVGKAGVCTTVVFSVVNRVLKKNLKQGKKEKKA